MGVADPGTLWPLLQRAPWEPRRVVFLARWKLGFQLCNMDFLFACSLGAVVTSALSPGKVRGLRACASPFSILSSLHQSSSEYGTWEDCGSQGKAAHVLNALCPTTLHPFYPFAECLCFHRRSRELGYLIHFGAHSPDLLWPDFCLKSL